MMNEQGMAGARRRRLSALDRVFLGIVTVVNLVFLLVAWKNRSWGAFGIAIAAGPATNGVLCLGALIMSPWVRDETPPASLGWHVAIAVLAPAVAVAVDAIIIFSMDLYGC